MSKENPETLSMSKKTLKIEVKMSRENPEVLSKKGNPNKDTESDGDGSWMG